MLLGIFDLSVTFDTADNAIFLECLHIGFGVGVVALYKLPPISLIGDIESKRGVHVCKAGQ